jgi:hypothetical protein
MGGEPHRCNRGPRQRRPRVCGAAHLRQSGVYVGQVLRRLGKSPLPVV